MGLFSQKAMKLGDVLVKQKLITEEELQEALELQKSWGSRLGEILVGKGKITYLKLYKALADHYKLEFIDLQEDRPDTSLMKEELREEYRELGLIPVRKSKDKMIIAVTDVNPEVISWATDNYNDYTLVITSPFDILWAIQHAFEETDDEDAREKLYNKDPKSSAKTLFSGSTRTKWLVGGVAVVGGFFFFKWLVMVFF
jgi:hypothetical protein